METQLNIFCTLTTLFCIARFIDMMKVIFILGKLPTFQTLEKEKEKDLILIFLGTQTFPTTLEIMIDYIYGTIFWNPLIKN